MLLSFFWIWLEIQMKTMMDSSAKYMLIFPKEKLTTVCIIFPTTFPAECFFGRKQIDITKNQSIELRIQCHNQKITITFTYPESSPTRTSVHIRNIVSDASSPSSCRAQDKSLVGECADDLRSTT